MSDKYTTIEKETADMVSPQYLINDMFGIVLIADKGDGCNYSIVALEWSGECNGSDEYELIMSGKCSYDGIRHAHFGDDGYINYPSVFKIARIFAAIYKFEYESDSAHSSDCDDEAEYKKCCELLGDNKLDKELI